MSAVDADGAATTCAVSRRYHTVVALMTMWWRSTADVSGAGAVMGAGSGVVEFGDAVVASSVDVGAAASVAGVGAVASLPVVPACVCVACA